MSSDVPAEQTSPEPVTQGRASRLLDHTANASAWVAGALLLFQVASVTIDVISRFLFNVPIPGVVAFNEWSLLLVAFLGAAWLQRQDGHVRMDVLTQVVQGRLAGRIADVLAVALGIVCCGFLVFFTGQAVADAYARKLYDYFKLRDVPIWPFYAVMTFGSALWMLTLIRDAYRRIVDAPQRG